MRTRRSTEEIDQLLKQFEASGKTRADYCREVGIAVSTLGRYLKRRRGSRQRLVRVSLRPAPCRSAGFALVLGNGRRIESDWEFSEPELARLISVAEAV